VAAVIKVNRKSSLFINDLQIQASSCASMMYGTLPGVSSVENLQTSEIMHSQESAMAQRREIQDPSVA
jgi:hypothetical protein